VIKGLLAENRRMLGKLLVIVLMMFGFGYSLVPMYRAICEALGINILSVSEQRTAGGSWLGIDSKGRVAALTNIRNGQTPATDKRSRGELVANFLSGGADPRAYLDQVRETAGNYNGFNLLFGDEQALYWISNDGDLSFKSLEPGIYGLSNGSLDTPWPKVVRAKAQFASLLCTGAPDGAYYEMLADTTRPADNRLPNTGVSLEWERLLSSICIESDTYGTRASSIVRLIEGGRADLRERVIR
jgi:uncharacterized protein with NRDE domain